MAPGYYNAMYNVVVVAQVLSLIREENSYCEQEMARLDPLKGRIYDAMVGYMKETDEEVGGVAC